MSETLGHAPKLFEMQRCMHSTSLLDELLHIRAGIS